jgi:hypothetical protein
VAAFDEQKNGFVQENIKDTYYDVIEEKKLPHFNWHTSDYHARKEYES